MRLKRHCVELSCGLARPDKRHVQIGVFQHNIGLDFGTVLQQDRGLLHFGL